MARLKPVVYCLPLLLCILLVFSFSSQSYDKQTIIPYLNKHLNERELGKLLPNIAVKYGDRIYLFKHEPFRSVEFLFRKAAHLFMYSMLGGLLYLALFPYKIRFRWKISLVLLLLASAAAVDEWNQTLHLHRKGEAIDVGLDFTGGIVGLIVSAFILYVISKRKKRERAS
ncbi:hypothetical protein PAESOLCIP111_01561 [Paenibacillus solanacearum]|uniref:VanZ-like domain-containing protein n=1 Tax=Paenibacillus solanacearum TaxID=2048548 RepID=A0A916NNI0_9BACL|nr:VanZ family protein [Paenibacillus solanacearum]CAG7613109.1 hypothetical protein PAESOLCIP111_01561 [Paenibacillus solanacearum]